MLQNNYHEMYITRTMFTFPQFISNYVGENKIRRIPKMLLDKGLSIL